MVSTFRKHTKEAKSKQLKKDIIHNDSSIYPTPIHLEKPQNQSSAFLWGVILEWPYLCHYVSICQWFNNCLDDIFCTTQTCYGEASSWARVWSLAKSQQGLQCSRNVCQSYIFCATDDDLFVTKKNVCFIWMMSSEALNQYPNLV